MVSRVPLRLLAKTLKKRCSPSLARKNDSWAAHGIEATFAFPDKVMLTRVGRFENFRGVRLKVAQAKMLEEHPQPGEEAYYALVLGDSLRPTLS